MSGHTIGFGWEIRKLAFWKLSILDYICCPASLVWSRFINVDGDLSKWHAYLMYSAHSYHWRIQEGEGEGGYQQFFHNQIKRKKNVIWQLVNRSIHFLCRFFFLSYFQGAQTFLEDFLHHFSSILEGMQPILVGMQLCPGDFRGDAP